MQAQAPIWFRQRCKNKIRTTFDVSFSHVLVVQFHRFFDILWIILLFWIFMEVPNLKNRTILGPNVFLSGVNISLEVSFIVILTNNTKFKITMLLGRFALIFYLNYEHVLFVYILKQKQQQKFADSMKKFIGNQILFADFIRRIRGFSKFFKIFKK